MTVLSACTAQQCVFHAWSGCVECNLCHAHACKAANNVNPLCLGCFLHGHDYLTSNYVKTANVPSAAACQSRCQANAKCNHWTWASTAAASTNINATTCWEMHEANPLRTNTGIQNVVSGPKFCGKHASLSLLPLVPTTPQTTATTRVTTTTQTTRVTTRTANPDRVLPTTTSAATTNNPVSLAWTFDTDCKPGQGACPTKHIKGYCTPTLDTRKHTYGSLTEAKNACISLGAACFGVYDEQCDHRGAIYLCDASMIKSVVDLRSSSSGSCVFEKPPKAGIVRAPLTWCLRVVCASVDFMLAFSCETFRGICTLPCIPAGPIPVLAPSCDPHATR